MLGDQMFIYNIISKELSTFDQWPGFVKDGIIYGII